MAALMRKLFGHRAPAPAARLEVQGAMLSHLGRVRETNEDAVLFDLPRPPAPAARLGSLLLVADGMGGHAAGEIASTIAATTMHRLFYASDGAVPDVLARCLDSANEAIRRRSEEEPECRGMGTTCTVLAIRDDRAWLGHIGDSRAYIQRDGALRQLSEDDTLVAELIRQGSLTAEEAALSPDRHVLIRALGTHPTVAPRLWSEGLKLCPDDRLLLCSDGLHDLVDDAAIADVLGRLAPGEACEALVEAALQAGGYDNVSVGVFSVGEIGAPAAAEIPDRPTRPIAAEPPGAA